MTVRTYATPVGQARAVVTRASRSWATLVLGHGAGGGIEAPDLAALAAALPAAGVTVVRVEQPWRVAGRRVATPPPTLDRGWLAVLAGLRTRGPLVVGGRSAGARVACRTATAVGARGVVALSFPLRPPGRPDVSRLPELVGAGVPTLVLQGERDAFGGPGDFPAGVDVRPLAFADHSLRVPRSAPVSAAQTQAEICHHVLSWTAGLLGRDAVGESPRRPGGSHRKNRSTGSTGS